MMDWCKNEGFVKLIFDSRAQKATWHYITFNEPKGSNEALEVVPIHPDDICRLAILGET